MLQGTTLSLVFFHLVKKSWIRPQIYYWFYFRPNIFKKQWRTRYIWPEKGTEILVLHPFTLRPPSLSEMTTVFGKAVSVCVGLIYLSNLDCNYAHWVGNGTNFVFRLHLVHSWISTKCWIIIYRNQFNISKLGLCAVKFFFILRNYWGNSSLAKNVLYLGSFCPPGKYHVSSKCAFCL